MNRGQEEALASVPSGEGKPGRERLTRVAWIIAAMMALTTLGFAISVVVRVNLPGHGGESLQLDFTAFWAAAKLTLAGESHAIFDPARLEAAMAMPPDVPRGGYLWLYPPAWLMVIAPLGLLPFSAAFIVFTVIAYLVFAASVWRLAAPLPGGLPLILAGPTVVMTLHFGNNSLLWTGALVASLAALAQGRGALAGGLVALLTIKPQLGLLIPVALAAGGHWRAIGWATAGTAAIGAVSTLVMGPGYWLRWIESMEAMSTLMEAQVLRSYMMVTWYALFRFVGLAHEAALGVQAGITLGAAASVGWVWRRPVSSDLKSATLCIGILVATPYAWHYELALALVAVMFLARDGFGQFPGERIWLGLLWLGQVPGLALEPYLAPAVYAPPLLTATLALCVWRARAGADVAAPPRFASRVALGDGEAL